MRSSLTLKQCWADNLYSGVVIDCLANNPFWRISHMGINPNLQFQFSHWHQQLSKNCSSRFSLSWSWHLVDMSSCEKKTFGHVLLIFVLFLEFKLLNSKAICNFTLTVSQQVENVDQFKLPNQHSEKSLLSLLFKCPLESLHFVKRIYNKKSTK